VTVTDETLFAKYTRRAREAFARRDAERAAAKSLAALNASLNALHARPCPQHDAPGRVVMAEAEVP
jgi:hypothetical protein